GDYSLHQKQRHSVGPSGGIYQISIDDRLYQNVDRYRPIPQDDCRVDVITISDLPFALHSLKLVFNGHTPAAWPANGYMDINEFRYTLPDSYESKSKSIPAGAIAGAVIGGIIIRHRRPPCSNLFLQKEGPKA
ncbi:hypothetical protein FRC02_008003, partial [Tulasnella sp. 418]